MTLNFGLPHAHHRNAEQQQEIREARRMLKEKVMDDWEYPPLPAYQKPATTRKGRKDEGEERIAGFKFHAASNHDRDAALVADLGFEPAEWRERDYSSEDDGEEAEAEVAKGKGSVEKGRPSTSGADQHHRKLGHMFKFEGPDSVRQQIEERKTAKRRKRQQALDDEVGWNDGLAHWLARRDAWCCARTTTQVQMLESNNKSQTSIDAATSSASALSDASVRTSPRTSTSTTSSITPSALASSPSTTPDIAPSSSPPTATTSTAPPSTGSALPTHPAAPPSHTLIPLAPTLLPNHPIRKRINPALHPEIYSKIIVSGRTPSVPINLLTLTRALVQGWKDDGEWPPKPGVLEKPIAGRKKNREGSESSLRSGVRAVGRVLRITGTGSESKEKEKG